MKRNHKVGLALAAACLAWAGGAFAVGPDHTITVNATVAAVCRFVATTSTVNLTLDPNATSTVSQPGSVTYRCTKGTSPVFGLTSGSGSGTGGTLAGITPLNTDTIPYTFTSTPGGAGTGLGAAQNKTLTVTVSVNQANAADVTPDTYRDTIVVSVTP